MKRAILLSALCLMTDQLLKLFFQYIFPGGAIHIFNDQWGFTYVINNGTWLKPDIPRAELIVTQLVAIIVWVIMFKYLKVYYIKYRKSLLIDLSFAFFTTGIMGNIVDHLLFGYVRDFFINPIAISNFADVCGEIALALFIVEWFSAKAHHSSKLKD